MEIKELQKECHKISVSKGWWEGERSIAEQLANIHGEASEAWEQHRVEKDPTYWYYGENDKPEGFPVELADIVIRVMDTCQAYDIDLEWFMNLKNNYNKTRPYRHGNKNA